MQELENFLISIEKRAFRMARLATKCDADALDIVQDSMLGLATHYAQKNAEDWKPLFFRILESRIMDWHRKQTLRKRLFFWKKETALQGDSSEDSSHELEAGIAADTPEGELVSLRLGEHLLEAVVSLPIKQQQCFILRSWEGLSIAETALAMKLNESSVKTHYARAMQKLKQALAEYE